MDRYESEWERWRREDREQQRNRRLIALGVWCWAFVGVVAVLGVLWVMLAFLLTWGQG